MSGLSAGEVRSLIEDKLRDLKVPLSSVFVRPRSVAFLVRGRYECIPISRGTSFYGMQALLAKIERVVSAAHAAAQHRDQIDLEDLTKERT